MAVRTTLADAQANLDRLCDQVVDGGETVIIRRRGAPPVVLMAADEWRSLMTTLHLLSSPANAARLHSALESALAQTHEPTSVAGLRREFGLDTDPLLSRC